MISSSGEGNYYQRKGFLGFHIRCSDWMPTGFARSSRRISTARSPSLPDAGGGEEEFPPLSPTLCPLVPHGEREQDTRATSAPQNVKSNGQVVCVIFAN